MSDKAFTGSARRTFRRIVAYAGVAALTVTLAACGSSGGGSNGGDNGSGDDGGSNGDNGTKLSQIAIVTPETEADHGWNQQGLAAAKEAADEAGVKLDVNSGVGYDNTQQILTQVANNDNQFVIAWASGFTTAATRASQQTDVPILTVDNASAAVKGSVGVVTFSAEQGGYLGGIAAAMTTKTDTIGMVLSAEDINWFTMSAGFIQGARSVNPDIKIVSAYVGSASYADSAGGKKVANQLIAAGADVIMGMGDGATVGYLSAIENSSKPVKYIATIGDVSGLVKNPDTVLTSVRWNMKGAFVEAIKDVEAGTFGDHPYDLDLKNGGFSLQDESKLPQDVQDAVDKATKGIEDGSITVDKATNKDELAAMLKG